MIPQRIFRIDRATSFRYLFRYEKNGSVGDMARSGSDALLEIGQWLKAARKARQLTQDQVAEMAGLSRPRYREIETGSSAARATTLINIARALGLELRLIPQAMVPAVDALLRPHDDLDDLPAFIAHPDEDENV